MNTDTDRIERSVILRVPRARVWKALTTAEEFGRWFGARFDAAQNFVAGERVVGRITYPGYEHLTMELDIERIEPEHLFSWRWHPAAIDPDVDYSGEPTTLVVFELKDIAGGTLLSVVESGLDQIPIERRGTVLRLNRSGWDEQMGNIEAYVAKP